MSRFCVEFFCLTAPKNFVKEPFCAVFQKISGSEKVYGKEGEGVSRFSVENFLSRSAEKFRRGIFQCFISFWYRKMLGIREGEIHDFPSKTFCLTVPKIFVGTPQCFTSFGYRKMLGINRKIFWQGSDSNPEPTA